MASTNTASLTSITWQNALQTFKKTLPPKDVKAILVPTKPEDLIAHLKRWKQYQQGRSANALSAVESGLARIQRFNTCVDVLSQGLPDPATLLWGSIRFVLKVCSLFEL